MIPIIEILSIHGYVGAGAGVAYVWVKVKPIFQKINPTTVKPFFQKMDQTRKSLKFLGDALQNSVGMMSFLFVWKKLLFVGLFMYKSKWADESV